MRHRRTTYALLAVLAAAAALRASADPPPRPDDDGPPAPKPPYAVEEVKIQTADGWTLAATYGAAGGAKGAPAVVLVPMEGTTRAAWEPLFARLEEFRVPWLAIDPRGRGGSVYTPSDPSVPAPTGKDLQASMGEDVRAAVEWLEIVRGHDEKRIGVMGAGLGAAAAIRCVSERKVAMKGLVTLTPRLDYEGLDTEEDAHHMPLDLDFWVFTTVEDNDLKSKKGPLHLIYAVERDRNAPPNTPRDERVLKRRGIPPRYRAFDAKGSGTKMIGAIRQMDALLAGWWARRLETIPNAVLYDGSIEDPKGDYADPGWDAGALVPTAAGHHGRALRWGRRAMVGASLPKETHAVRIRIAWDRGPDLDTGQLATVAIPSGAVTVERWQRGGARRPPIETSALALDGEQIPTEEKTFEYGEPSFEAEIRLPDLPGDGVYHLRVALELAIGTSEFANADGVDVKNPTTFAVVADSLATYAPPAPADGDKPKKPR